MDAEELRAQPTRSHGIRANAALTFAAQMTSATFTAIVTLFLVRALGPEGYGVFALALAVGGLVALPSDLGITGSAARFIAEHRGDADAVAQITADGLKLKVLGSGVVNLALFALAGPIATAYDEPALEWPLRVVALSFFGQGLMHFLGYAFVAQGKAALNLRAVSSESAVEATASIALVLLGTGVTGAACGRAIGYTFGALVALAMTMRMLRGAFRLRARFGPRVRQIAGYAGALSITQGAWSLFTKIDTLLIGGFLGSTSVALFEAPLRFLAFLNYPGLAVANAVSPRLARHANEEANVGAFLVAIRLLIVVHAALAVPLLVWAEPLVDLLLGAEYAGSVDVLRALAPYAFMTGLAPLVSITVGYLGEARRRVPISLATVAINVVIDIVLIPEIGIIAGAIGTDVAFAFYVVGHFWICTRLLSFSLRPILATFLRATIAAAAMATVLYAIGDTDLSLGQWMLGVFAGPAAFVAVLLATGEVSREELARARVAVARRLRRRTRTM